VQAFFWGSVNFWINCGVELCPPSGLAKGLETGLETWKILGMAGDLWRSSLTLPLGVVGFGLDRIGGVVAVPLLGLSIVSIAAISERCRFWWRIGQRQDAVIQTALKMIQVNGPSATAHLHRHLDLPLVRVFLEALELDRPTPSEFTLALETAARAELPNLRRFSNLFDTIITIAPLLGLLGTVLGLIQTFSGLQLGDPSQTNAGMITTGIGTALTSTVFGLVVAITTALFASAFRSLYRRQRASFEEYGGRLELIYRRFCRQHSSAGSATANVMGDFLDNTIGNTTGNMTGKAMGDAIGSITGNEPGSTSSII